MAYVTRDQVESVISEADLNAFLDDDGDGTEDTGRFTSTANLASIMVDAFLAGIYQTPFTNPPALCQAAALSFFCEMVYQKRLTPDQMNPFKAQSNQYRELLDRIRKDGTGLDQTIDRAFTPGVVISAPIVFNQTTA